MKKQTESKIELDQYEGKKIVIHFFCHIVQPYQQQYALPVRPGQIVLFN